MDYFQKYMKYKNKYQNIVNGYSGYGGLRKDFTQEKWNRMVQNANINSKIEKGDELLAKNGKKFFFTGEESIMKNKPVYNLNNGGFAYKHTRNKEWIHVKKVGVTNTSVNNTIDNKCDCDKNKNNIYLLKITDAFDKKKDPYEYCDKIVVVAKDELNARTLAQNININGSDIDGKYIKEWTDKKWTSCEKIGKSDRVPGVICASCQSG